MRELFELCGADRELLFSPYCWRVRLALAHKGLDWQSRPIHFTDKEAIAFSGQKLVPVLTDGDETINDSLAIFAYLDRRYPTQPCSRRREPDAHPTPTHLDADDPRRRRSPAWPSSDVWRG